MLRATSSSASRRGDSLQSRSIHSLAKLLAQFEGNQFNFIGPAELAPSQALLDSLTDMGAQCAVIEGMPEQFDADVIYVNRLQEERFDDPVVFDKNRRLYRLTTENLAACDALILDPLPRIDEIDVGVDKLPNALYFKQASYGVPVRMALLSLMLNF